MDRINLNYILLSIGNPGFNYDDKNQSNGLKADRLSLFSDAYLTLPIFTASALCKGCFIISGTFLTANETFGIKAK